MNSLFKFLITSCLCSFILYTQAQSVHAGIRENRGKKLTYESLQFYYDRLQTQDSCIADVFHKNGYDSISIHKNGSLISGFSAKNYLITASVFKEYYPGGALKTLDSFNIQGYKTRKRYFNFFSGENLSNSKTYYKDGTLKSVLYYSHSGPDSLLKEWYPTGVIKIELKYPLLENPTKFKERLSYYPGGILAKRELPGKNYSAEYNETGVLKFLSYDTLILGHKVNCRKNYYSSGSINLISYFQNEVPCYNWEEYTMAGTLSRTLKKLPPHELNYVEAEPAAPEIFIFVEEHPDYTGGPDALKKYFDENLNEILRRCYEPVEGNYQVIFTVTASGKIDFVDFKGMNAFALKETIKHITESMPVWKPGKMQGRRVDQSLVITLKVITR